VDLVKQRFNPRSQDWAVLRDELQQRVQRRGESLVEPAEDIERKCRRLYAQKALDERLIQEFAGDHFVTALIDRELKLQVRLRKPGDLREALSCALEIESILRSGQGDLRVRPLKSECAEGDRFDDLIREVRRLADNKPAAVPSFALDETKARAWKKVEHPSNSGMARSGKK